MFFYYQLNGLYFIYLLFNMFIYLYIYLMVNKEVFFIFSKVWYFIKYISYIVGIRLLKIDKKELKKIR